MNISETQWKSLQNCLKADLTTETGCLLIYPVDHHDEETKILPGRKHNLILTKQYLLGCYCSNPSTTIFLHMLGEVADREGYL